MTGNKGIREIRGIGPKKASYLARIGIVKIIDVLYYFPRRYEDRSVVNKIADLKSGAKNQIKGRILQFKKGSTQKRGKQTLRLTVADETGQIEVLFFNAAYIEKSFAIGSLYTFYGMTQEDNGRICMIHPEIHKAGVDEDIGILPVYRLTKGITQQDIRRIARYALDQTDIIHEFLPSAVIKKNNLCDAEYALKNIHFPESLKKFREARYRLIFDELFLLQMGMIIKNNMKRYIGRGICFNNKKAMEDFVSTLGYELTGAQKRVIMEIKVDMESSSPMRRLIQGDVGSGKTVVAQAALYKAAKSGYQGVMMAPTELLARQHFETFKQAFSQAGVNVGFISSSMRVSEKKELMESLATGKTEILIGTHAVIQPGVEFYKLGLVITDEQHRFGVEQRRLLESKGVDPDVIIMSATPIPRTLASAIYGDLEVSVIDELPPGRKVITTKSVTQSQRSSVYEFLKRELEKGRQAYVVAPLIEESDVSDIKSAKEIYKEIKRDFKSYNPALLHGSMKQSEKDLVMNAFNEGNVRILISTVIIEVGINVPNATIMIIENSERFGLAQLHQLRGRVGRGKWESFCFLINNAKSEIARERAAILENTNDGFEIAERDMILRGPGEFFGTRQHGIPELQLANLMKHIEIMKSLKPDVDEILNEDPELLKSENAMILHRINKMFDEVEHCTT